MKYVPKELPTGFKENAIVDNVGIAEANKDIAIANNRIAKKIKKSAYEIAQATFKSSQIMSESISKISDELERKRKNDEYYLLLNLIDSLEDKIINLGGDPKEIYDKLCLEEYQGVIDLTISEIQMILHTFAEKEQLEWLIYSSGLERINPLYILYALVEKSVLAACEYGYNVIAKSRIKSDGCDLNLYISECSGFVGKFVKDEEGKWYYGFNGKSFPVIDSYSNEQLIEQEEEFYNFQGLAYYCNDLGISWEIDCDSETKMELLKGIKESYEKKEILTIEEMKAITQFQNVISQLNCEIILNNFRMLQHELSIAYKNLKFEKKN